MKVCVWEGGGGGGGQEVVAGEGTEGKASFAYCKMAHSNTVHSQHKFITNSSCLISEKIRP